MNTNSQFEKESSLTENELIEGTILLDIMETYQPKRTNLLRQKGMLMTFLQEVSKKIVWSFLFENKDIINRSYENREEIIRTIVKQNKQVLGFYGIV